MQDLTIKLIQPSIKWHDAATNRKLLAEKLAQNDQQVDLIVLPEMFTTGFTMETTTQCEPEGGPTYDWMIQMAEQSNSVITGSIIVESNGNMFNRMLWAGPDGTVSFYDKRHLFRMAEENQSFSQGNKIKTFELKGWRIRPAICYDLRFPVWCRNTVAGGGLDYDILLLVANWPAARIQAWDALLKARAIENQSYCIGVNRVGMDGEGVAYNGHSGCYNYLGSQVSYLAENESVELCTLSKQELMDYRGKFPAFKDADKFVIES